MVDRVESPFSGHLAVPPGHDMQAPLSSLGVTYPPFQILLNFVREGHTWIKLSAPNRVSATPLPPYDDVLPLAQALLEAMPDHMLWATDWPHPNISP